MGPPAGSWGEGVCYLKAALALQLAEVPRSIL
jgi:hypothetical protein